MIGVKMLNEYSPHSHRLTPETISVLECILSMKCENISTALCAMSNNSFCEHLMPRLNICSKLNSLNAKLRAFDIVEMDFSPMKQQDLNDTAAQHNFSFELIKIQDDSAVYINRFIMEKYLYVKMFLHSKILCPERVCALYVTQNLKLDTIPSLLKTNAVSEVSLLKFIQEGLMVRGSDINLTLDNNRIFWECCKHIVTGRYDFGESRCRLDTLRYISSYKRYLLTILLLSYMYITKSEIYKSDEVFKYDGIDLIGLWHAYFYRFPDEVIPFVYNRIVALPMLIANCFDQNEKNTYVLDKVPIDQCPENLKMFIYDRKRQLQIYTSTARRLYSMSMKEENFRVLVTTCRHFNIDLTHGTVE